MLGTILLVVPGPAAAGCPAALALQRRLGILPERRTGHRPGHRARPAAPGAILTMPDHKSDIDAAVLAMKRDQAHVLESVKVDPDGTYRTLCARCGRLQDTQRLD